jgi:glycine betaine/proline transport system permease protein
VVLQGLGRLDIGRAGVGGIGIVLVAIILDRLTQAMANRNPGKTKKASGLRSALRNLLGRGNADLATTGEKGAQGN